MSNNLFWFAGPAIKHDGKYDPGWMIQLRNPRREQGRIVFRTIPRPFASFVPSINGLPLHDQPHHLSNRPDSPIVLPYTLEAVTYDLLIFQMTTTPPREAQQNKKPRSPIFMTREVQNQKTQTEKESLPKAWLSFPEPNDLILLS